MSSDRHPTKPTLPRPARLAIRIPHAGSSGILDVAELRAEPLVASLSDALARPRPAPPPRPPTWPGIALRSALALSVTIVGLAAVLRLAPSTAIESTRAADGQLSMHDASTGRPVLTSTPASAPARATERAAGQSERAAASSVEQDPAVEVEPTASIAATSPPVPDAAAIADAKPAPRARARAQGSAPTRPAPTPATREAARAPQSRAISVDCVLDPQRCDTPKAPIDAGSAPADPPSSRPAPLPEKLSTAQLKQALAVTKADARRCGPEHGADAGVTVRVQLSIEGTSGAVLSAIPLDQHAQGALGLCVARALGQAKFPRFTAKRMGTLYSVRL